MGRFFYLAQLVRVPEMATVMEANQAALVVVTNARHYRIFTTVLATMGYQAQLVPFASVLAELGRQLYDLVLLPVRHAGQPTTDLISQARATQPEALLLVFGRGNLASLRSVLHAGADDLVPPPTSAGFAQALAQAAQARARRHEREVATIQALSLSLVGRLLSGLAHEINNPLTPIVGLAELLAADLPPGHIGGVYAAEIATAALRIGDVIQRLDDLSSAAGLMAGPLDLRRLLDDLLVLTGQRLRAEAIDLRFELPEQLPTVWGSRAQFKQALLLLIDYLRELLAKGGVLRLNAQITSSVLVLEFLATPDTFGQAAILNRPLHPLAAQGTLGLAVARAIVLRHGGQLEAETLGQRSASLRLILPLPLQKASDHV